MSVRANVPDELKPSAAAGIVVLRRAGTGWTCLVLRAYRNWDFPKGLLEEDESPREAAIREVWEETDLGDLRFRWGDRYRETLPFAGGKVARYFIAESPTGEVKLKVSAELGRPEHDEYRWVTFDDAEDLLPPRLAIILDWARELVTSEPDAH